MTAEMKPIERIALAVREEIVRQYRDDERGRCPAGSAYYEEHIGPALIARAALAAMREPPIEMIREADKVVSEPGAMRWWRAMIDQALKD